MAPAAFTTPAISSLHQNPSGDAAEAWDNYVLRHPFGTAFHLSAWQRVVESTFGHEPQHLLARDHDEIVGLLPLFLVRSRIFGRMLISTPQAAYGGILSEDEEVHRALLSQAEQMARDLEVRFLELRNFRNDSPDSGLPAKDLYVTFRQQLHSDPEKNFLSIPRKTRAEAREGIRRGLEFKVDDIGTDAFYRVYSRNLRDLGTPAFPKTLFTNGRREFGERCKIFSVHWKGKPVSAVWTLFYQDQVLPHYGGSLREFKHLPVNNFMYWMLMRYGCENGYRLYDFGRSKKGTGSFDFKKRWGMQMSDLPYRYALLRDKALPDTSPLNPRFSLSVRLWRCLPLFVTNRLGPIISRHLT